MSSASQYSLPASYENMRCLRTELGTLLAGYRLSGPLINKVVLCFSEVATNFVEHSSGVLLIGFKVRVFRTCLELEVVEWSDSSKAEVLRHWLSQGTDASVLIDDFELTRSGGRGSLLVKASCDTVVVRESYDETADPHRAWANGLNFRWSIHAYSPPQQILIVDNDHSVNALYCAYLSNDYTAIPVFSVDEALTVLNHRHIDLVVSDMRMPDKSGLVLREEMSTSEALSDLPFILISAYDLPDIQRCINMGIDGYLEKPFKKGDLCSSVDRVLRRSAQLKRDMARKVFSQIRKHQYPTLPSSLDCWQFSLHCETHRSGGGDILLWHQTEDGIMIVMADVMGHDDASKYFSYTYRGYMRGVLSVFDCLPSAKSYVEKLSKVMYQDGFLDACICTCCVIRLDNSGGLELVSAGHPSPLLIQESGVRELMLSNMLPGLQEDIVYTSTQYTLGEGERLMLYTDGLFDEKDAALNGVSAEQQRKGLDKVLTNTLCQSIEAAGSEVFSATRQGHSDMTDDSLLLLVEYTKY